MRQPVTPPKPPRRAKRTEAATQAVAAAVTDPDLRELMTRAPLWRRPGFLVRRLHQIHSALFHEECAAFDITPVQYAVLTAISINPGADQHSIAQEVGIDRTNVADVLSRLARRGLVRRQRGEIDRRTYLAWLTPEGETLTRSMLAAMRNAQERLLSPLDEPDRETFMSLLMRLINANNDASRATLGPAKVERAA